MENIFNLPTEEECTLSIVMPTSTLKVDVMEVYEMYLASKRAATELKREDPLAFRPIFIEKFNERYEVELNNTSAALLIQAVSLQNVELKKKCSALHSYLDVIQVLQTPSPSTEPMQDSLKK
jgi:hypothetical protein